MSFQVIDRNGCTLTLEDGSIVPDGARLLSSILFADATPVQRMVFKDSQDDAEDEAEAETEDGENEDEAEGLTDEEVALVERVLRQSRRGSAGSPSLADARARADEAWYRSRDALGRRNKRFRNVSSLEPPEHQKQQPTRPGVPGGKSGPWRRDAHITDAERAYNDRNVRLENAWRKNKTGIANAAPAGATSAAWVK